MFRETAFRETGFFSPSRGWQLAAVCLPETTPFSVTDPHPTPAPRSCVGLTWGRRWRSHPDCCQGKQPSPRAQHPRERVLPGPSSSAAFPMEGEGSWQGPAPPALPGTELPLLCVISPGRGVPYYVHTTKVMADVLRNAKNGFKASHPPSQLCQHHSSQYKLNVDQNGEETTVSLLPLQKNIIFLPDRGEPAWGRAAESPRAACNYQHGCVAYFWSQN